MRNMICDNCKIDRLVTDFIKNQKYCYRCEYQKKLQKSSQIQMEKVLDCRICGNEIVRIEGLKKRQRSVFCSKECAIKGHKKLSFEHWTRPNRKGTNG